jgi:glutathione S-transferase
MSNRPLLLIGNQNYSSWSLRPWLFLRHAGVDFDFEMVPLDTPAFAERIGALSPTGKVPLLVDGERVIWDSLAICEYAREHYHIADAWPREPHARAVARSVVAEMHSGFAALRTAMPMNLRRTPAPLPEVSADVARDIARIIALWQDCRARFGGDGEFLFGRFGIADAFFAPVVARFQSYAVALDGTALAYVNSIASLPAMREWRRDAETEGQALAKYDSAGSGA